jgi:hypothetical protein
MQQIAGQLGYDEKGIAYSYAPGNYKKICKFRTYNIV